MTAYLNDVLAIFFDSEAVLYTRYLADHGLLTGPFHETNKKEFWEIRTELRDHQ